MNRRLQGSVMPRWEGAAPLDIVIGVMAFLAALALGASLIAGRTAEGWRAGLAGGFTVQILPPPQDAADSRWQSETTSVLELLRRTKEIARADLLSDADTRALLSPWLGSGALLKELPLPRLVDATIVPEARIDLAGLARRLKQVAPDSLLDDHARWLLRLKRVGDAVISSSLAILGLIALATVATVTFATRAGLSAHHDIVSLLHQMGARPGFIARAFEWHYFVSALIASVLGTALAGGLFAAAGSLELAGIEPVPFLPPLGLPPTELAWLCAVPAGVGLIALATARISVLAALTENY